MKTNRLLGVACAALVMILLQACGGGDVEEDADARVRTPRVDCPTDAKRCGE